jgi:hypothetical protein
MHAVNADQKNTFDAAGAVMVEVVLGDCCARRAESC